MVLSSRERVREINRLKSARSSGEISDPEYNRAYRALVKDRRGSRPVILYPRSEIQIEHAEQASQKDVETRLARGEVLTGTKGELIGQERLSSGKDVVLVLQPPRTTSSDKQAETMTRLRQPIPYRQDKESILTTKQSHVKSLVSKSSIPVHLSVVQRETKSESPFFYSYTVSKSEYPNLTQGKYSSITKGIQLERESKKYGVSQSDLNKINLMGEKYRQAEQRLSENKEIIFGKIGLDYKQTDTPLKRYVKTLARFLPESGLDVAAIGGRAAFLTETGLSGQGKSVYSITKKDLIPTLKSYVSKENLPETAAMGTFLLAGFAMERTPKNKIGMVNLETKRAGVLSYGEESVKGVSVGLEKPYFQFIEKPYTKNEIIPINIVSETPIVSKGFLKVQSAVESGKVTYGKVKVSLIKAEVNIESPYWQAREKVIETKQKFNILSIGLKEGVAYKLGEIRTQLLTDVNYYSSKAKTKFDRNIGLPVREKFGVASDIIGKRVTDVKQSYISTKYKIGATARESLLKPYGAYQSVKARAGYGLWWQAQGVRNTALGISEGLSLTKTSAEKKRDMFSTKTGYLFGESARERFLVPYAKARIAKRKIGYGLWWQAQGVRSAALGISEGLSLTKTSAERKRSMYNIRTKYKIGATARESLLKPYGAYQKTKANIGYTKFWYKTAIKNKISDLKIITKPVALEKKSSILFRNVQINLLEPYREAPRVKRYGTRLYTGDQLRNIALARVASIRKKTESVKLSGEQRELDLFKRKQKLMKDYKGKIYFDITDTSSGKTLSLNKNKINITTESKSGSGQVLLQKQELKSPLVKSMQKSRTKNKYKLFMLPKTIILQKQNVKQKQNLIPMQTLMQSQAIKQKQALRLKVKQKQKLKSKQKSIVFPISRIAPMSKATPSIMPNYKSNLNYITGYENKPKPNIPPPVPPFNLKYKPIKSKSKKSKKMLKPYEKITPSLLALEFNIRGKQPKWLSRTGIVTRPI